MEELSRQFKAGEIDKKQLKEAARDIVKGYGKDIGIDYEVVYLDESTMPKDAKGSTGSAYILDEKNRKVLIPIDVNKIKDTGDLFGTIAEEVSHGKDALAGRQDKKVAEDETNKEEGLESLGRPANDYVKNKLGDNSSDIQLSTDGIDLTNADVGKKVGDVIQLIVYVGTGGVEKVLRIDPNGQLIDVPDLFGKTGEFTLGALKAGGEDLSLNTYKIPKRFQYNTLPYKYGELFGHSTMSALGILGFL
ncbi:hypothetical protein LH399_01520 [Fusobacterium nucleatum]